MPDLMTLMTFGQCLKEILAEKKISASALARMMELKSRNSLFRILDDTSGPAAQMSFYDQLIGKDCLALTDQQRNMLLRALEISRLGVDCYRSNMALHRLFTEVGRPKMNEPIRVQLRNGGEASLEQLMEAYASGRSLSMNITGCCDRGIFEIIASYLLTQDTRSKVSIRHYLYTGGDDIIRSVTAVQPVLYFPNYRGYCVEPGGCSVEREQIFRANNMGVQFIDKDGKEHIHILALFEHRRFLLIDRCSEDSLNVFNEIVRDGSRWMRPIKSTFARYRNPEDYRDFMEVCGKLERGRAIYIVRRDIPVAFIHPDTVFPAIEEGFRRVNYCPDERQKKELCDIQLRRFENFYHKSRPTHIIFSQEEMMKFARTGEQQSCFLILRPYTPQERVSILAHIRVEAEDNPYFNVYFFKPSFQPPDTEISLYEGKGVCFSRIDTEDRPSADYTETLITHKAFCEKYKAFFLKDLIVNQVISREETLAFLDHLIEVARQSKN